MLVAERVVEAAKVAETKGKRGRFGSMMRMVLQQPSSTIERRAGAAAAAARAAAKRAFSTQQCDGGELGRIEAHEEEHLHTCADKLGLKEKQDADSVAGWQQGGTEGSTSVTAHSATDGSRNSTR